MRQVLFSFHYMRDVLRCLIETSCSETPVYKGDSEDYMRL